VLYNIVRILQSPNVSGFVLLNLILLLIHLIISGHIVCHILKLLEELATFRCNGEQSSKCFVNSYILHENVHLSALRCSVSLHLNLKLLMWYRTILRKTALLYLLNWNKYGTSFKFGCISSPSTAQHYYASSVLLWIVIIHPVWKSFM
jgi:hypothetical protein